MLKITASLADRGFFDGIHILARWESGLLPHERIDAHREVTRLPTWGQRWAGSLAKSLAVLEWYVRIIWHVRRWDVTCINCHSLIVMPLCVLLKYVKGCRLIYDTHELETETTSTSPARKWLSKRVERMLIPHANAVIVVGERIRQWYQSEYQLDDVVVIRNLPRSASKPTAASNPLREELSIPAGEPIFLYQGVIDEGRGVELLIKAFLELPTAKHLVLMGYGGLVEDVKNLASSRPNIHFREAVSPDELPAYTSGADVGLAIIENVSLSYYYCLPNKVFEYLQAGVPAIVSDFPEMAGFVDTEGCGWKVDVDVASVRQLVAELSDDEIARKQTVCRNIRHRYTWQSEEQRLLAVYEGLSFQGVSGDGDHRMIRVRRQAKSPRPVELR